MKKKLPLIIGIAIIIIAIIVALVIYFNGANKDDNNNPETSNQGEEVNNNSNPTDVEIDLAKVSSEIDENGIFAEMATEDVTTETLESFYGVDLSNVNNVVGKYPLMNIQSSMYVLVEAKEGQANAVKEDLEAFGEKYEKQWERYLPEQYDYVKNRKIGVIGNYVYLIIAENSDELEKLVK